MAGIGSFSQSTGRQTSALINAMNSLVAFAGFASPVLPPRFVPLAGDSAPAVPVNTVAPALDDSTPIVGQLLGASEGTWDNSPTSFAWLWYRDDVSIEVTTETYTVEVADIGCVLKRRTVATNATGDSEPVFSDSTSAILNNATTFTANGGDVMNGATINLDGGTSSVTIAATNGGSITTGPTGDTGLSVGDNTCTFTVTAADGETVLNASVTLHVLDYGLSEVTRMTAANPSHAAYLLLYKGVPASAEVERAFVINCGALPTIASWNFSGLASADFATGGYGKYVVMPRVAGTYIFWFDTGTESAPVGLYGVPVQVIIGSSANDVAIAPAFASVTYWAGFTNTGSNEIAILTSVDSGATVVPPSIGDSAIALTIVQNGRDAAGAISGKTSIIVDVLSGGATEVRAALIDAINTEGGWTAEVAGSGYDFDVTDVVSEPRTDASNYGALAALSVTQQGRGPA